MIGIIALSTRILASGFWNRFKKRVANVYVVGTKFDKLKELFSKLKVVMIIF